VKGTKSDRGGSRLLILGASDVLDREKSTRLVSTGVGTEAFRVVQPTAKLYGTWGLHNCAHKKVNPNCAQQAPGKESEKLSP
jgi:hypothetical protein